MIYIHTFASTPLDGQESSSGVLWPLLIPEMCKYALINVQPEAFVIRETSILTFRKTVEWKEGFQGEWMATAIQVNNG